MSRERGEGCSDRDRLDTAVGWGASSGALRSAHNDCGMGRLSFVNATAPLSPTDAQGWEDYLSRHIEGHKGLEVVIDAFYSGRLGKNVLTKVLGGVWQAAHAPRLTFTVAKLVTVFREAGFLSDDPALTSPPSDIFIYRGCHPGVKRGLAWTTEEARARWFCDDFYTGQLQRARDAGTIRRPEAVGKAARGGLFKARAHSDAILAVLNGRTENEIVVDPRLLTEFQKV